ncbi:MAG: glycerophosphodiester phosphodiesterase [Actinomycetes bacterium]
MSVITFAHRGARTLEPENTLAAFRRALADGAGGLESDAWLSGDGEVVLVHDPVVRRGLRRSRVARTTAADLQRFGVPRLADLYEECGAAYELSIDLKDPEAAGPMIRLAREHGAAARLWLCVGSRERLRSLRDAAPDVRLVHSPGRGKVVGTALERLAADLAADRIDALNLHHTDWTGGIVSLLHRFGLRALAWDVQETRHILGMLRIGIDGIYCDRVDRMLAAVGEWSDTPSPRPPA